MIRGVAGANRLGWPRPRTVAGAPRSRPPASPGDSCRILPRCPYCLGGGAPPIRPSPSCGDADLRFVRSPRRDRLVTTPIRLRVTVVTGLLLAALAACGTTPSTGPATPLGPTPTASAGRSGPSGTPGAGPPSVSGPAAGPSPARPSTAPARPASCAGVVAKLSRREEIGQVFMVGVPTGGLTSSTARTLSSSRAGSVLLLDTSDAGRSAVQRLVGQIRAATHRPAGVKTMLATDQEGGLVQRLRGPGFSDVPSARTQGTWSAARLRTSARQWGAELRAAGIDADLAPVADVVPADLTGVNQPIGVLRRGYSSDPAVVASHTAAFVERDGRGRGGDGSEALPGPRSGPRQHGSRDQGGRPDDHPARPLSGGFPVRDRSRRGHGHGLVRLLSQDRSRPGGPRTRRR